MTPCEQLSINGVQEAAGSNPVTRTKRRRVSKDTLRLLVFERFVHQRPLAIQSWPLRGRDGVHRRNGRWFKSSHSDHQTGHPFWDGPFDLFWYCDKLAASCRQIKTQRSGFDLERKKEPADVQFSRLFRKPRKRNGAGFF